MAGPYPKGRDWFDLLWYRSLRPVVSPNLVLLQNALDQTEGIRARDASRWLALVRRRADQIDTALLARDAGPFLERSQDALLLSAENITASLR